MSVCMYQGSKITVVAVENATEFQLFATNLKSLSVVLQR